jgi:hypothetical protein
MAAFPHTHPAELHPALKPAKRKKHKKLPEVSPRATRRFSQDDDAEDDDDESDSESDAYEATAKRLATHLNRVHISRFVLLCFLPASLRWSLLADNASSELTHSFVCASFPQRYLEWNSLARSNANWFNC